MSDLSFFCVKDEINSDVVLRGIVFWSPKEYTTKILKENTAFEGKVSHETALERCRSLNLSLEEYLEECRAAFKSDDEMSYSHCIDGEYFNTKKYCKAGSGSAFKIVFSSIHLKKVDYSSTVLEVLDHALKRTIHFDLTLNTLMHDKESLLSDNQTLLKSLEEMEKDKLEFERAIYQKFVNLLNSKKEFKIKSRYSMDREELPSASSPIPSSSTKHPIFDAETDTDETDCESILHLSTRPSLDPSPRSDIKNSEDHKVVITSDSKSSSNVESILNSLDFLDPSISFLNK